MHSIKKMTLLLFVVLLLLSTNYLFCFASERNDFPIMEEIEMPQDLNFTVSNTCSGHAYFMQAAADETGCFAIYSRHVDPSDDFKVDFKKAYIDIYQSDGAFLQELSFATSLDFALELKDNAINLYFYESVLTYDLTTQELIHYAIPKGVAVNGGLYKQLRRKEFTAGNWTYSYKKGFDGYVKLMRSDGEQAQVLVEMPGTGSFLWKVILPGGVIGIISMIIIVWQFKRSQNRKKTSQKHDDGFGGQGDGSVVP